MVFSWILKVNWHFNFLIKFFILLQASSEYSDCTFRDPLFNQTYDLSSLKRDTDYTAGRFKFNICGTSKSCEGGVCYETGDEWKKFGGISEALFYSNGVAHLTYLGDDLCDELDITYSTRFEFRCSHDQTATPRLLQARIQI